MGIKTVEWGKFHVIFKISRYPQILVFKISDQEFKVCGLAPTEILNSQQDINLILSPMLRQRGTKTAFIGYRKLEPVVSISDLSKHRANSGSTSDPIHRGTINTCPTCGSELVKRNGKFGIFWGCKSFPKCRFTRNQNVP